MELTLDERRELDLLAPRLRLGLTRGFRLFPFTERQRGRDAAMGFASTGRLADYAPLMSYVLGEPVYRSKEVSPRFDLVVVPCLTGEDAFDARILQLARAWAYIAIRGLSGTVAILAEPRGRFVYQAPTRDVLGVELSLRTLSSRASQDQLPPLLSEQRHFSGCLGAYYEGFHIVVIGAYWEIEEVDAYCRGQPYGMTFCMVEQPSSSGSRFLGDSLPQFVVTERLKERREILRRACRNSKANCLVCQGALPPLVSLRDQLCRNRIL